MHCQDWGGEWASSGERPAVVNGSDTVSGTETVSESEMVYDTKTTSSQERGKVISGNELRSLKDKTRERRTYY